jgi:hypothetical protein
VAVFVRKIPFMTAYSQRHIRVDDSLAFNDEAGPPEAEKNGSEFPSYRDWSVIFATYGSGFVHFVRGITSRLGLFQLGPFEK